MASTRYAELPDETLMDRYARGDAAAFEELFARYQGRAYAFFLRRTGSEDRAADLYQELFLRIHRARASYDPQRPFAPWFFQIARHLLVDWLRRGSRSRERPAVDTAASATSCALGPERQVAAAEQTVAVLDQLSDIERYVLVSAKVEGREYAELAAELGKSVVAIKKVASRAMRRLRSAGGDAAGLAALP